MRTNARILVCAVFPDKNSNVKTCSLLIEETPFAVSELIHDELMTVRPVAGSVVIFPGAKIQKVPYTGYQHVGT